MHFVRYYYFICCLLLGACGFKPVHAPDEALHGKLANINVSMQYPNNIPSRLGQVLEYSLTHALHHAPGEEYKYNLNIQYEQGTGFATTNTDGTVVRKNVLLRVKYQLQDIASNAIITAGETVAVDGFDTAVSQYSDYVAYNSVTERNAAAAAQEIKMKIIFALKEYAA